MKLGYFPGCSLQGTAKEFDISLWKVLHTLGVTLTEIQDWNCCGASSGHATSHVLSVALPVRNLLQAQDQGLDEIVSPCAACYSRLVLAQHEMKTDARMRQKVEFVLERPWQNGQSIQNLIQLFHSIGLDKIKEKATHAIGHIKAACYYGCLLVRPNDITHFDDAEAPVMMDQVVQAAGAKTVDWNFKTECCGASHAIAHVPVVEKLSKQIIDNAIANGANAIVVACPMCHSNLDMRQKGMQKHYPGHTPLPVLYLSEILGLAFGIPANELGMNLHFISAAHLLEEQKN